MFEHVPALPLILQDLHVPVHETSQQTASAQKPLLQSAPAAQAAPLHLAQALPPQSTPVSSPSIMPLLHKLQTPLALHVPPGHVVPTGTGLTIGKPLLHVALVQGLPSSGGTSASYLLSIV